MRNRMRNRLTFMLLGVGLAAVSGAASAHDNVRFSVAFGAPTHPVTYFRAAPVAYRYVPVYAPHQVVYYAPAPQVYYGPQVRYVSASPRVVYMNHQRGWQHHGRDDHRDRHHW